MKKKPTTRKVLRVLLIAIALAVGAVLLGIVPFNAGFVRGPIETAVRDATGLELAIGDRIMLRLGSTPSVTSGRIVIVRSGSNPLIVVDSLRAKLGLFALLGGRIHFHELRAEGAWFDYCSALPDFPGNSNEDTAPPSVAVDAVQLDQITIRCGPASQPDPLQIEIGQVLGAAPAGGPIDLKAQGSVSGIAFTLTVTGGELDQLLEKLDRFPIDVSLESEAASVAMSGELRTLPAGPEIAARLEISATDVQSLADNLGVSLPEVSALRAEGRIRSDFRNVELIDVSGEFGESRFAFDANANPIGDRTRFALTAALEQLDLSPFMIDDPEAQRPDLAARNGDIDLGGLFRELDAFDAEVLITARRVLGAPLSLDGVEVKGRLEDGVLELQTLDATVLGGHVSGAGGFDSQSDCPELNLQVRGSGLDIAAASALLPLDDSLGGHVEAVNLKTSSCGRDLQAHRQSLRAEIEIAGGRVSLGDEDLPLIADQLNLVIEPGKRSRVRLIGALANEQVRATLAIGSLEALLGSDPWPIELEARGAGSKVMLNGQARIAPDHFGLDALIDVEAPHFGTLHAWTAGSPDARLPLRAATRLRLDESRLVADAIALSLGGSDMRGRMVWNHAQQPDLLDLSLHSTYLDLDEIEAVFGSTTNQPEADRSIASGSESRLIPTGVTLPPIDLDVRIDAVHAPQIDLQDFNISGRLRTGLIDGARVSLVVEEDVLLHGNLDLDLRRSPAEGALSVAAENVDVGRLLRKFDVSDDLRLRADGLDLLVTTEGMTLKQFLLNSLLEANLRGFSWHIPEGSSGEKDSPEDGYDLSLEQLKLTMAPDQPTIWTSSGQFDEVQLELWMESPSLIDALGDAAQLPLTLVAAAGDDVVMLEASVDLSVENRFLTHVLLSGEVMEIENRALADLVSPLADYEVQSRIILTEDHLEVPDLQLRLGDSSANGNITATVAGERRAFDIVLHAPYLQTDDLLYWVRDSRATAANDEAPVIDNGVDPGLDNQGPGNGHEEPRGVFFIARDIVREFRERNDLDIRITVDELRAGTALLGDAELRLYVDENDFRLQPLSFNSPGGGVDAEYTAEINDGRLDAGLKVHAEALSYGGLLRLADHESEARGLLYLDTQISASTEWSPDEAAIDLLLRNANGSFSFAAWPENVEAGVLDLWTANLVLALLPRPAAGEASKLNCLVARLVVEDGVMKTRVALLDSTDTIIRGRGTIDLAQEQLDLLVGPQAKREKFLSASTPVTVTGPFDDFQIGVEPAGMFGTMMKWWMSLVYVPFKWLTGERFPADGTATCFDAMDWELSPELHNYFLQRDFSAPPSIP